MCKNTGCNSCQGDCGCGCTSCSSDNCNSCCEQSCGCEFEVSAACVRLDGNGLECIDVQTGDTLETALENLNDIVCTLSSGKDGIDGIDGIDGADSIVPGPQGPQGPVGPAGADSTIPGPQGPQGLVGNTGGDGLVGRGIAVFVQTLEPSQLDFDTQYGSVLGFGVNSITGSNQIKPGDLWIEPCPVA